MRKLPLAIAMIMGIGAPTLALSDVLIEPASTSSSRPSVGLGLTVAFGSGGIDTGIGLRVFSSNRRNRAVGSLGLDYMFTSQSLRGTVGVGYLGRNVFGGAEMGYNFNRRDIDFGLSIGGANTRRSTTTSPPQNGMPPIQNGEMSIFE